MCLSQLNPLLLNLGSQGITLVRRSLLTLLRCSQDQLLIMEPLLQLLCCSCQLEGMQTLRTHAGRVIMTHST